MKRWTAEWLLLRRDRTAWLIYTFFAVACTFASADSVATYRREARLHAALVEEEAERMSALRRELSTPAAGPVAPWNDPANPGPVGRGRAMTYALLPAVELAVARSHAGTVSAVAVSTEGGVLDRALGDLTQPRVQSLGSLGLGFLLLVVLPLVVLLLCFDVVVRDHERGTLRLLLAGEVSPRARYLVRVTARVAPIVVLAFAAVLSAVALVGRLSAEALPGLFAVLCGIGLYTSFWASIALLVQSWFRTASASGIVGLAAWAAFVILVPTILSATAEATTPIPSRIDRTEASREAARLAGIKAEGLLSQYLEDHPELAGTRAKPGDYYVRRVAMDDAVAAARAPIESRFERARERRSQLTREMAIASPVSLFAGLLDELGGSSDARVERFRRDVDAFQARFAEFFNAKTMRGERLSAASLAERPAFEFADQRPTTWPLVALAVWTLLTFALALLRLRRAIDLEAARPARRPIAKLETSVA